MSDAYERPTGERLVGLLYCQRRWAVQPIAAFVLLPLRPGLSALPRSPLEDETEQSEGGDP